MFKNKLGYLLIIIISGLFAILYNEYYTGIIFLVVAILPIILYVILLNIRSRIHILLETDKSIAGKGEKISLKVILKNTSIFPITRVKIILNYYNNFTGEVKQKTLLASIDHRSSIYLSNELISKHCGLLHFHIKSIRLYDYFSLFSIEKKELSELSVSIVPEVYELKNDIIIHNNQIIIDSDTYSTIKPGDDPSEVFRIRDYREGDSLNRIHWKLSYKKQELMIKEFSDPINDRIVILLDQNCGQDTRNVLNYVDGLLECALSLSFSLLCYEYTHYLLWYDGNKNLCNSYEIKNEEDMNVSIKNILNSRIESNSILKNISLITDRSQYTHMFLITSRIIESEVFNWVNERKGSFLYILYVNDIMENPLKPEIKNSLMDLQVFIYEIDINNIANSINTIGY